MLSADNILGPDAWIPPGETPCAHDPDAWTDHTVQADNPGLKKQCMTACKTLCEFTQKCLDYALRLEKGKSYHYRYGIWGGVTPLARSMMDNTRNTDVETDDLEDVS